MKVDPAFLYEVDTSGTDDRYTRRGSFMSESELAQLYSSFMEKAYISAGAGGFANNYQVGLTKLDRFGAFYAQPMIERVGITLITRPRLNLSDGNIRQDRHLMALDTADVESGSHHVKNINFILRCLLDTYFCSRNREQILASPLIDLYNPFLVPLCNNIVDMSGWPSFTVDSETMDGGFHNEDYIFASGSDMLNRGGELTLTFRNTYGNFNMSLIYMWLLYMAMQRRGRVIAYEDDIYEQRLNYTVSIYRFTLDPSLRYIQDCAKATGCFPKDVPRGNRFNFSAGDSNVSGADTFSVPFAYNKVEYLPDFGPLKDFNRLMTRYVGGIDGGGMYKMPISAAYNGLGYPFIVSTDQSAGLELEFRAFPEEVEAFLAKDTVETLLKEAIDTSKSNREEVVAANSNEDEEGNGIDIFEPQPSIDGDTSTDLAYVSLSELV